MRPRFLGPWAAARHPPVTDIRESANYARTSGYDSDGRMTWSEAQAGIAALNAENSGLGVSDWRLPAIVDTGKLRSIDARHRQWPPAGCIALESTRNPGRCPPDSRGF